MALELPLMSYADFLTLPPESPGELVDGVLTVGPTPTFDHQRLVGRIFRYIDVHLDDHPEQGEACVSPMDVVLREDRPGLVLQPDVLFISAAREGIIRKVVHGAPDLVVEVVSPSSKTIDPGLKRERYARHGAREYWIVWPDASRIDVYLATGDGTFGPPRSLEVGDLLETSLLPGFSLKLERLFRARHR